MNCWKPFKNIYRKLSFFYKPYFRNTINKAVIINVAVSIQLDKEKDVSYVDYNLEIYKFEIKFVKTNSKKVLKPKSPKSLLQ